MMENRSINLFGRVSARAGKSEVDEFTTTHSRNLLAFLAMHSDVDHPRNRLVNALWPMQQDGSARNRLSVTLYHLRRKLDEVDPVFSASISSKRSTVRLDSRQITIDLIEFRRNISAARLARSADSKRRHYLRAMEFYGGPLTPDITSEWTLARQIEASEMFQEASVWVAGEMDSAGDREKAHSVLSRSLDVEPYSEGATEMLTKWYVQSGKYEMAVSCAKRLRRALAVQGRAPSRAMLDRIDELNTILTEKSREVVFADETVLTVLSCLGVGDEAFVSAVRGTGGALASDGQFGLFANPLIALEAGRSALKSATSGRAYLFTTLMGLNDPVPSIALAGLHAVSKSGVYGSDCFACLARAKGVEVKEDGSRGVRVWRVT
jgi:DNA-binding SARP family transcriptional activator